MARRPADFEWSGFDDEQRKLLARIDVIGNNGWARNSQTAALMPAWLGHWAATGATFDDLTRAMELIGYGRDDLHQLARWESKRTTGKFGR